MFENDSQQLENDVLILYVLCRFEMSIPEKALTEIILSPGLISYFSFQSSLARLAKDGLVAVNTDTDGVTMYAVSEEGRRVLGTLPDAISPAVRGTYDEYLAKEKNKITMETNINAYPFVDSNKNQCVRCYIRENGNKIVDIRIPVPDKETALAMCANWKTDAYSILMQIMTDLSGEMPS